MPIFSTEDLLLQARAKELKRQELYQFSNGADNLLFKK
jgi:hypothetical protein